MKSSIFDRRFEEIFTPERIAWESARSGISIEGDLFDFAPHKSFLLPKNDEEFRHISVPDQKAKLIQKILSDELSQVLRFSDRSYAYQKNKSPLKAINRVKHIAPNYEFVVKADIDDFFDSIDHDRLMHKLRKIVADPKIIYLIALFLKNGTLFRGSWQDKLEGVYQGDVLSPLLSNIYLHAFDVSLEKRQIEFVRYADDLIFFAPTFEDAKRILRFAQQRLAIEKLHLADEKTYIRHKSKPFEYLGVKFDLLHRRYSIDNERLMQKVSKISKETKPLSLPEAIEKLNEHIQGFSNYYAKIIDDSKQLQLLQKRADEIIVDKIVEAKLTKTVTKKQHIAKLLDRLLFYYPQENFPSFLLERAYEKLKLLKPTRAAMKTIENKKRRFFKNSLKSTELVVTKQATYLSFSRGKIALKTKDEPVRYIPFHKIRRIIVTNIRTSISTYLIHKCAQQKIDIDFIHRDEPFALLTYYKAISKELHLNQLKLTLSPTGLRYAKAIHYAKAKNQINLLKYFNKRRKDPSIQKYIDKMSSLLSKINEAKQSKALMAIEGQISQNYWNAFRHIIHAPSFQRTHKDSVDPINQALNYGYAILYNRIQSALVREGLNIYYSFLHTTDYKKPTLVFDMIEPFRQPIVDREIISILTKGQKLHSKDGRLDERSKKIVLQNIQERLGSFTKTRFGKTTFANLISFEANALKKAIENLDTNHRFFIARY